MESSLTTEDYDVRFEVLVAENMMYPCIRGHVIRIPGRWRQQIPPKHF
jgi:hypothetical protein